MCVSSGPAQFTGTTIYQWKHNHPVFGEIFVIGYENRVASLSDGPNAMLLHFPAQEMGQKHFLETSNCESILADMRKAITPPSRDLDYTSAVCAGRPAVEVFERGIYTVVLARDARAIPAALEQVPPYKRIAPNELLFDFYAKHFSDYPIALCCFNNREARDANPLLMWYRPLNPELFVLPALDCHTGGVPALDEEVEVDHWLIFSSDDMPENVGNTVQYRNQHIPFNARLLLPSKVIGTYIQGKMRNGDFALRHDDVLCANLSRIERIQPLN